MVAYSKGSWSRLFATTCHPLPPNQHATFYATCWRKRDIFREKSGLEPSYSESSGVRRRRPHEAVGGRTFFYG